MWDTVGRDVGKRREEELKTTFWKEMLDAGCRTARFENTRESAWDAIGDVKGSRTAVKSQDGVVPPSQHSSELPEQTPSFFMCVTMYALQTLCSHMPLVLWVLLGWGKAP